MSLELGHMVKGFLDTASLALSINHGSLWFPFVSVQLEYLHENKLYGLEFTCDPSEHQLRLSNMTWLPNSYIFNERNNQTITMSMSVICE